MQTLQEYLDATGTKRANFAKLVPTTEATLSRWCSGAITPSDENKARVQKLTNGEVPVTVWFSGLEDMPTPQAGVTQ